MLRFAIGRLGIAALVVLVVSVIVFGLTHVAADPARAMAGENATAADVEAIRKAEGFDRPLPIQYAEWIGRAASGDFGRSYLMKEPVIGIVAHRLPVTLTLGVMALAFALCVALPLGVLAAVRQNSLLDRFALAVAVLGQALPNFWFALVLIVVFGVWLQWLPTSGADSWEHMILPAVALGYYATPALMRLTRTGMLEALGSDYIRTARAKGLLPPSVLFKHALRNAVIPVVSLAAVQFGFMLGGSIVIEAVFSMHGVGYLAWESIQRSDLPVIQAIVLMIALFYVVLTFLADLLNGWLDPRLRVAGGMTVAPIAAEPAAPSPRTLMWRRVRAHKGLMFGIAVLVAMLLMALAAPLIVPHDPYTGALARRRIPPVWHAWFYDHPRAGWTYPLGTDRLGRDYLSRLIYGSQISLLIGFSAMFVSGIIGTTLGLLAGYFGGKVDMVVSFFVTTRLSLPVVLVALAVVAVAGSSLIVLILVLGLLLWDRFAVVMRAATQQARSLDYVAAGEAIGCSTSYLLLREVLPNVLNPLIVVATIEMANAILLEAALSFLGLGVRPPQPSWGLMLAEAKEEIFFNTWMIGLPGIALFLLVLGINLLGDGVRDVTAPENRN